MRTKVNKREITLGTDVEGALYHGEKRQYIPATTFNTPFTKTERKIWGIAGEEGSYHRDNILVEWQTPVVTSWAKLKSAILVCNNNIQEAYAKLGCSVMYAPITTYKQAGMVAIPEAKEMGCDPDFCAYTGKKMEGPDADTMGLMRGASGHLHIGGVQDLDFDQQGTLVRWLDVMVGLPLAQQEADSGGKIIERRKWYGQAGRFRTKPYGIEYRTLSNHWVNNVIRGRGKMGYEPQLRNAIDLTDLGKNPEDYGIDTNQVQRAINSYHVFDDGEQEDWYNFIYRTMQNARDGVYKARNDV